MPKKKRTSKANLEETLEWQLKAAGAEGWVREHRFHPVRRWRFDFAWPDVKLAVEVEGGVYTRGRHVRPSGFEADTEKYNEATLLGWKLLRFTSKTINSGAALGKILEALGIE